MNEYEEFLARNAGSLLGAGEKFEAVAHLSASSGPVRMKHYIAGATPVRIALVQVIWDSTSQPPRSVSVKDIPYREIESFQTSAFLNDRRILLELRSGERLNLALVPFRHAAPGQKHFIGKLKSIYEHYKLNVVEEPEADGSTDVSRKEAIRAATEDARHGQRLVAGIVAGAVAAVLGAAVWSAITLATELQVGWMAIAVGVLVGSAIRVVGRGVDRSFGIAGAVLSVMGCVLGNFLWAVAIFAEAAEISVPQAVTFLARVPSVAAEIMVVTFNLKDITFYILAAVAGYGLAIRTVRLRPGPGGNASK